jgi:hypothetical protein
VTALVDRADRTSDEKPAIDVVFSTMAMQEVVYFGGIASHLRGAGLNVGFINYYEPGDAYLKAKGFRAFSLQKEKRRNRSYGRHVDVPALEKRYGFDMRELVLHEKLTTNRLDEGALSGKVAFYLGLFEKWLGDVDCRMVVQELGGFIAPMTLYYACRQAGVDHLFIEPSMFPRRVMYLLNSLEPEIPSHDHHNATTREAAEQVVDRYHRAKPIAIPVKDKHRFQDATFTKFVNRAHMAKLGRKVFFKYILNRTEEYDAIWSYCWRHARMYLNRRKIGDLYAGSETIERQSPYLYFPFHVPLDLALTVRSSAYLDQIALLHRVAAGLPGGYTLCIKEHPAAIGGYGRPELRALLSHGNVRILHPAFNSHDVIAKAACVLTINSKVGVEALMHGKRVVVLGKVFYRSKGLTEDVASLEELDRILAGLDELLKTPTPAADRERLIRFLSDVHAFSRPGELYFNEPENIAQSADALMDFLANRSPLRETPVGAGEVIKTTGMAGAESQTARALFRDAKRDIFVNECLN